MAEIKVIEGLIEVDVSQDDGDHFTGKLIIGSQHLSVQGKRKPVLSITAALPDQKKPSLLELLAHFGLPVNVANAEITTLSLQAEPGFYDLKFSMNEWPLVENKSLEFKNATVHVVTLQPPEEGDPKRKINVTGELWSGVVEAEVTEETEETDGTWAFKTVQPIQNLTVQDLIDRLSEGMLKLPSALNLNLSDVKFEFNSKERLILFEADVADSGDKFLFIAHDLGTADNPRWVFASRILREREYTLDDLPLIGEKLSAGEFIALSNLDVVIASESLSKDDAGKLNEKIGTASELRLPENGITDRAAIHSTLHIGKEELPLVLTVLGSSPPSSQPQPLLDGGLDIVKWVPVQKSLGPLTFSRIGFRYQGNSISFMIDASLKTSGLTISVYGLTVTREFKDDKYKFSLGGLGVEYQSGPLEISGALLACNEQSRSLEGDYCFNGTVVVKTAEYSFSGLASYALLDGKPSMFVFVHVGGNFGGPPFFYVTGLAGGFGYNRELTIPEYDRVVDFPLIQVMDDPNPDADNMLQGLSETWVRPKLGSDWLAAGVKFLTFAVMESRVLVAANFSDEFTLSVLGVSKLKLPKSGQVTLVDLEMQLRADLKPAEGVFGLKGTLTENSYVLHPDCKASGTFAFFFWFAGDHQGDFVVTVGGYHADFIPPSHYPDVRQRLGINWPLGGLTLKGDSYLALTPSCAMSGGRLELRLEGSVEAWFTTEYNVLMRWKPVYIEAFIGVRVGVAATVKVKWTRIKKRFVLEVGADLELWGPDFGGKVHIDCWVVEFTIPIGAGKGEKRETVPWSEFREMLPKQVLTLQVENGLIREQEIVSDDQPVPVKAWIVRPDTFAFFWQSAVPATVIDTEILGKTDRHEPNPTQPLHIRPTGDRDLTSHQRLTLQLVTSHKRDDRDGGDWKLKERTSNVPEALWGLPESGNPGQTSAAMLEDRWTGLRAQVPASRVGYTFAFKKDPEDICEAALPFDDLYQDEKKVTPHCSLKDIEETIMHKDVVKKRDAIFEVLKKTSLYAGPNGTLCELADDAAAYLKEPPLMTTV